MNRSVTVIPPKRRVGNTIAREEKPKLKVAAYCRVSTDSEEQASSYEMQVEHYKAFIQKNEEWQFAGIFADDGISGTNTKKRSGFNRMIEECMAGHIDKAVTRLIQRISQNSLKSRLFANWQTVEVLFFCPVADSHKMNRCKI